MTGVGALDVGLRPLNWARLDEVETATPVIPSLLNEGEFGALIGQAEAGKSLLALEIAVALALGTPVLGHAASDRRRVMYVDMENPEAELAERLRRMGYGVAELQDSHLFYFAFPDLAPLDTETGGKQVAVTANIYNPDIIIFDTISRLVEGKEDSADTWQNLWLHTMIPLRRQKRTVLRLDHQGHDSNKGARGSSAKRDDVDVAWIMTRKGTDIMLKRNKGRGLSHPDTLQLRRHTNPTRHVPVVGGRLGDCIEALDLLGVHPAATRDEAAELLRKNGFKFGNDVIGKAQNARRPSASKRTGTHQDE